MKRLLLFLFHLSLALSFTWSSVGFGVSYTAAGGGVGRYKVFVGYGGFGVTLPWTQHWVESLYTSYLSGLEVVHLYAVQGPQDSSYAAKEIGNTKLVAHLLNIVKDGNMDLVFVAGHSSGSFVAHEMLGQIISGFDPQGHLAHKIVYYNLDGGSSGFTGAIANNLIKSYWVYGFDQNVNTDSANHATMQFYGRQFGSKSQVIGVNADSSGCDSGAVWCMHVTLITTHPHLAFNADAQLDYGSIDSAHPVQTQYFRLTGYDPTLLPTGDFCVSARPSLNMRATACNTGRLIVGIPHLTRVLSVSCCTNSCGFSWRKISYRGQTGYVMNQFLKNTCLGALDENATEALDTNSDCLDPTLLDGDVTASASSLPMMFTVVLLAIASTVF